MFFLTKKEKDQILQCAKQTADMQEYIGELHDEIRVLKHTVKLSAEVRDQAIFERDKMQAQIDVRNHEAQSHKEYAKEWREHFYFLREAGDNLGSWMSAALEDPNVCKEMKRDITNWFAAMEVVDEQVPTSGGS